MKLPSKLTLGNKPKANKPNLVLGGAAPTSQSAQPTAEETKQESQPKYSSAEVKLMMIAIEDLHKNRFRQGWFHLLKFTDEVEKKPSVLDELKVFAAENKIEPDEWTEPVVVFSKPKQSQAAKQTSKQNKPKFRPNLNLGLSVDDDDSKMLPNPHQNFPPPQVQLAPPPQRAVTVSQQQAKPKAQAVKKPPGLSLQIKDSNADKDKTQPQKPQLSIGVKPAANTAVIQSATTQAIQPPQTKVIIANNSTSQIDKEKEQKLQKALQIIDRLSHLRQKRRALLKFRGPKTKPIGAARLIHALDKVKLSHCRQFFLRLQHESHESQTNELFHKVDQSLQQIGQKVKQFQPAKTHTSQLHKINLLCVQGLQEKLDRAANLYAQYAQKRHELRDSELSKPITIEKKQFAKWNDDSQREFKLKGCVKLVCILNRYAFTNKRVLRLMRIWERVRIENEMQLLVKELTTIENQFKVVQLLQMNQYCKDRMQSVFYTWLANCSSAERASQSRSQSLNSAKQPQLQELFLRSTQIGKQNQIRSFFFSPAKRQSTTQKMISQKAPSIQFPPSTISQGASFVSQQQKKQLAKQIQKQKELVAEKRAKNQSGSFHKTGNSLLNNQQDTTQNHHDNAQMNKQNNLNKSLNVGLQSSDEIPPQDLLQQDNINDVSNALQLLPSEGQKTATNVRRPDSQLKLINTDSQTKDKIPPPMHSQQYKSGNQKFDMLREHLNLQGGPGGKNNIMMNLSDISEYNNNKLQQSQTGFKSDALKGQVIHDICDFGSINGPQLMVSEVRTDAVLRLFKIMVCKGKQKLKLAEHLNYLKRLQIKTKMVFHQTGIFDMSPQEEEILMYSQQRIKAFVLDQWKLFSHYQVKIQTRKNIEVSRIFTILENHKKHTIFDALHRLSKYNVNIKLKSRVFDVKNKLRPEQRYERLAVALNTICQLISGHKRTQIARYLQKWQYATNYSVAKEEIQRSMLGQLYATDSVNGTQLAIGGQQSRQMQVMSQRSARQNDPQKLKEIEEKSQQLGFNKVIALMNKPRAPLQSQSHQTQALVQKPMERLFKKWKYASLMTSKRREPSKIRQQLKRQLINSHHMTLFGSFKLWKVNAKRNDNSSQGNDAFGMEPLSSQDSSMIEKLDQALIKSQSMIAAQMQASLSDKTQSIKFKAKDQAIVTILTRQILHKQPSISNQNRYFKHWKAVSHMLAQRSQHSQDWQNEQIITILKEKQDLEKKVEYQNEANEQIQSEISQVLIETECQDCKQKQLKLTMLKSQSSQKRIRVPGGPDGAVSEYWDLESSQASNQLENIGRFVNQNDFDPDNQDSSLNLNLDSQITLINDPLNKVVKVDRQNSVLSQILDNSDNAFDENQHISQEVVILAKEMETADKQLQQNNDTSDLLSRQQLTLLGQRRQTEQVLSQRTSSIQNNNQIKNLDTEDDKDQKMLIGRRFSDLMIDEPPAQSDRNNNQGPLLLQRKDTNQSASSSKRISLNSTGAAGGLRILSGKHSHSIQNHDDSLSQLQDPQNLEQTNEDLKQELAFVQAEVDKKYQEMLQERDQFMHKIAQMKQIKQQALEQQRHSLEQVSTGGHQ